MQLAIFRNYRIPNLCKNSSVFLTLLIAVILALILTLLRAPAFSFEYFSLAAMYLIWLLLGSLSILCLLRKHFNQWQAYASALASIGIFLLVFVLIELVNSWIFQSTDNALPSLSAEFFNRAMAVLCVAFFLVSFFSLLHTLDRGAQSESQSRLQALQSRIRPHFLFNSLNTISELVSFAPDKAEQAIQSLSALFRASLDDANDQHTLKQELALCQEYLSLEKWRLGARLNYQESINVKAAEILYVPKLILQPLLENAIVHGVAASEQGGEVELDVRETRSHLSIKVSNTKPEHETTSRGSGLAVENIRERLFVLYDDDYYLKLRDEGNSYSVVMRLPKKSGLLYEYQHGHC
ncbi:MAG: histidine kinase [Pseudomonadota bacterium]